jgi:adhesin/invasin
MILAVFSVVFCQANITYALPTQSITLSASSLSIPADGVSSITINALLIDSYGGVPDSGKVQFKTNRGHFSNGIKVSESIDVSGSTIAISLMSDKNDPGIAEISCTAVDTNGQNPVTQYITVSFNAVGFITLTASPTWLPADGKSSSNITALIANAGGVPVAVGTEVEFSTSNGLLSDGLQTPASSIKVQVVQVTGGIGSVNVSLIASVYPGNAVVTCTSNGMSQSATVVFGIGSITLSATPSTLPDDGKSSSEIKATIMNSAGLPVSAGTSVIFQTDLGKFSNGRKDITVGTIDNTGIITTSFTPDAEEGPGVATVICSSGHLVQSISISIGSLAVSSITMSANPTTLLANGASSSTITAKLLDISGNLLNQAGIPVTFETSMGLFSNGENKQTVSTVYIPPPNEPGKVVVSLIAPKVGSGPALVKCSIGGLSQAVIVNIEAGTTQVADIVISAVPTFLYASDTTSFSTITATLYTAEGKTVSGGLQVDFKTILGKFSTGEPTMTGYTNSSGVSVAYLFPSGLSGTAEISVTSGSIKRYVKVIFKEDPTIDKIVLSASPTSVPADNMTASTITAITYDQYGVQIQKPGMQLVFAIATGGVGHFSNNSSKITVATDDTGKATALVYSEKVGSAGISASTTDGNVNSDSVFVTFTGSGQPASIILTAEPTSLPAGSITPSKITATVYDENGKTVSSGLKINFETSLGLFANNSPKATATTNSSGVATAVLYSSGVVGTAKISAMADAVISIVYVNFTGTEPTSNIVLIADPPSIPAADKLVPSKLKATLYDSKGQVITAGAKVTFQTTLGYFSNGLKEMSGFTDATGIVTLNLYSEGTIGTAKVSASSNGITAFANVSFTGAGPTTEIVVTASPTSIPSDKTSYSVITATLYDKDGKTVASGVSVEFTTKLGYFTNNLKTTTVTTNSKGIATINVFSGSYVGLNEVTASSNGVTGYVYINFTGPGPSMDIVLSVSSDSISSDKLSYSAISATVYDMNGNKVNSGVAVDFATTLGYFSNSLKTITAYTNVAGVATAYLYSGSFVGIAQITVSSNNVTRYTYVNFTGPGPAASITMGSSSSWVPADGYSYVTIAAKITDSIGNGVAAGTSMIFMTTLGTFSNGKTTLISATPDATGVVSVSLISGSKTGIAVITCSSGSITGSVSLTMTKLEFETEPNNDMEHADAICFGNVYMSQLFSPYEEDWYYFTIKEPQRISINFLTTAIPEIAGDCKDSTTVGTYRVDIRDRDNNILMSYQNIDCSLDNGIWETGVVPAGTYYIAVYCPRLPDNGHYLSTRYYMAVFNELYRPCDGSDRLVNSASLSQDASAFNLHIPIIGSTSYFWVDLEYDPVPEIGLVFRLKNYGDIEDLDSYRSCNMATLFKGENNYILHIPNVMYKGVSYQTDLAYVPTTDGKIWFSISGIWLN